MVVWWCGGVGVWVCACEGGEEVWEVWVVCGVWMRVVWEMRGLWLMEWELRGVLCVGVWGA